MSGKAIPAKVVSVRPRGSVPRGCLRGQGKVPQKPHRFGENRAVFAVNRETYYFPLQTERQEIDLRTGDSGQTAGAAVVRGTRSRGEKGQGICVQRAGMWPVILGISQPV